MLKEVAAIKKAKAHTVLVNDGNDIIIEKGERKRNGKNTYQNFSK